MDTARRAAGISLCLVLIGVLGTSLAETSNAAAPTLSPTASEIMSLKRSLGGYLEALVRPDLASPTSVNITLGITHITLDEMQSMMSVSAWVRLEWRDHRNVWEDSENPTFKAVKVLHMTSDEFWTPDITLKNSWAGKGSGLLDGSSGTLYPDGRTVWTPSALLEVYCDLDLRRWPFERHTCSLHLGSWTLDIKQLGIGKIEHTLEFPGQTGEFIVDWVNGTLEEVREEGASQPFAGVLYTIALHREPGTYKAVIFTPAAVVIILCLATFLLPPRAGEKVILGGVNAMLICLFLIYFAHSLPVLTNQTPLIVVFYSTSLYLVCVSLVMSVVVLNISRQHHSSGLPWTVKRFLTGPFGRFLLLSDYIERIMGVDHGPCSVEHSARSAGHGGHQEELPVVMHDEMAGQSLGQSLGQASSSSEIGTKSVSVNLDWLLLAAAIDRVLFIIYSVLFTALAVAFQI